MTAIEITEVINSIEDADEYWNVEFGYPDYLSKPEDVPAVENRLLEHATELELYERRIKNMHVDNLNHYVINKTIALHFIVEAGQNYLKALNEIIFNTAFEKELEKSGFLTPDWNSDTNLFSEN